MGSELIDGLRISLVGISLTFLALALLILVMVLLVRLFPEKNATDKAGVRQSSGQGLDPDERKREETAAAIAVGVCLLEQEERTDFRDSSLGKLLEE